MRSNCECITEKTSRSNWEKKRENTARSQETIDINILNAFGFNKFKEIESSWSLNSFKCLSPKNY